MPTPIKRVFDEDEENQTYHRQASKGESSNATADTFTDESFDSDDSLNGKKMENGKLTSLPSTIDTMPPSIEEDPEVIVFGYDLSHLPPNIQYQICASGVFFFNMLYGFLQELIQIQIAGREFALFLAAWQFFGYFVWSSFLAKLRDRKLAQIAKERGLQFKEGNDILQKNGPPFYAYLGLATLRALDLGLTNLSMKFLNYPAKTLIKSSRVLFTMMLGTAIGKKKYGKHDYVMVLLLVTGLCLFLHADMKTSAFFHPIGVFMLALSLTFDAALSNCSEVIMNRHSLGPDEFQKRLNFFSFIIMLMAAFEANEVKSGMNFFFFSKGTYSEYLQHKSAPEETISYSFSRIQKAIILVFFSAFGIFGGSCASAITKRFSALTMSITTTTRKAASLLVSFLVFGNSCTMEHILGITFFSTGLLAKSIKKEKKVQKKKQKSTFRGFRNIFLRIFGGKRINPGSQDVKSST